MLEANYIPKDGIFDGVKIRCTLNSKLEYLKGKGIIAKWVLGINEINQCSDGHFFVDDTVYQRITTSDTNGITISIKVIGQFKLIVDLEKKIINDLKTEPRNISLVFNPTEEMCLIAVKCKPNLIEIIENQTDEMCWIAIKHNPLNIRHIWDQKIEMCKYVVMMDPTCIEHVRNQTPDLCMLALELYHNVIHIMSKIRDPTEEIYLAALRKDGNYINRINDPNSKILETAIINKPAALGYIEAKNMTPELCLLALKHCKKPYEIMLLIPKPTDEMYLAALNKDISYIQRITNPSQTLKEAAIRQDYHVLQYIRDIDDNLCKLAIDIDVHAYHYIAKPSLAICQYARERYRQFLLDLPNPN